MLGRPNAGKSTLLNRILGEERLLTGPEPGITRDSIGLETEWRGRKLKLFDTAGLRRRARVVEKLEKLAVADALRAVRFAEVVVLLLDATIPFEKQDLTLADLVEREGRALVIGLNKWDLIDNKSDKARELRDEADRLLPQLRGARVIPVSGLTGAHVDKLMEAVVATHEVWNMRISTGRLNRWLAPVIDATPPPAVSGRRVKIRYMTQPKARPPFFVLFGNQVEQHPGELQALSSSTACARRSACSACRSGSRCARAARTRMRRRSGAAAEADAVGSNRRRGREAERARKTCRSLARRPASMRSRKNKGLRLFFPDNACQLIKPLPPPSIRRANSLSFICFSGFARAEGKDRPGKLFSLRRHLSGGEERGERDPASRLSWVRLESMIVKNF